MAKLTMTRGLPGSGKTSWALEEVEKSGWTIVRVNKDDLRASLGLPWSRDLEKRVIRMRDKTIVQSLQAGLDVISDDTNLAPKHEARLRELARVFGAEFEIKDFTHVPIETCIERDSKREGKARVGEKVIIEMAQQFLQYKPEVKMYTYDPKLPTTIICDLDGTLCLHNGRGPFDYDRCDTDLINKPVFAVLNGMDAIGRDIMFLSGREGVAREKTEKWLFRHGLGRWPLHMRAIGDYRKDSVVKLELFDQHVRGKFNVEFVLDDRDQVVKLWRDLGLTCLQVNYGAF